MFIQRLRIEREDGAFYAAVIAPVEDHYYFVCDSNDFRIHGDDPQRFGVNDRGLSTWYIGDCIEEARTFLLKMEQGDTGDSFSGEIGAISSLTRLETFDIDTDAELLSVILGGPTADETAVEDTDSSSVEDEMSSLVRAGYSRDRQYTGYHAYHAHHGQTPNHPLTASAKKFKLGIELEVECNNERDKQTVTSWLSNWFYCERDGSLGDYGVELITIPLRYEDACNVEFWRPFCHLLNRYARSWRISRTGLHVHVGREILGDTESQRGDTIGKLLFFYHHLIGDDAAANRLNCKLYGREHTYSELSGKSDLGKAALILGKEAFKSEEVRTRVKNSMVECSSNGRYYDINLCNSATIEFRKGKGSINAERISAVVMWSVLMTEYCRDNSWEELSFRDFYNSVKDIDCIKEILR